MNVGGDITLDRSVSSGTNLCPKNRVRFIRGPQEGNTDENRNSRTQA